MHHGLRGDGRPWSILYIYQAQIRLILGECQSTAKCLFSFSQNYSLLSGSRALETLMIGVHCKKRYVKCIDTIQYNRPTQRPPGGVHPLKAIDAYYPNFRTCFRVYEKLKNIQLPFFPKDFCLSTQIVLVIYSNSPYFCEIYTLPPMFVQFTLFRV